MPKLTETQETRMSNSIKEFVENLEKHENRILNHPAIEPREYDGLEKLIEIKGLCKEYKIKGKKFRAVDDMNLTLYKSQNIALLGSNGAGKTTTVEMLVGILKPSAGNIKYFFGDSMDKGKIDATKIGIQFQDSSYPQGLTVRDVIKSMNKIYGNKMKGLELDYLIKIFGVDEYIDNKAASLSGGQHQRLNALLALIHKPELVILDELSTGLDIKIKTRLVEFINNFVKDNKSTLLIVSHDINEINTLADRIVIMNKGKVIFDKTKDEAVKEFKTLAACLEYYI
ncbi:ABC transporter ATP-binding protein [Mycoplasmopsis fermentans]|nr:ABC transporter ATP-binding protein [Mycoplasmopsis fermentans]RMX36151.1 ABC transporter family protein [Mycoplasmopsis fermentans MF-I2]RMX36194.1 ABC transporter family protein [Mycoplasmopsis fermentans MF-I1]